MGQLAAGGTIWPAVLPDQPERPHSRRSLGAVCRLLAVRCGDRPKQGIAGLIGTDCLCACQRPDEDLLVQDSTVESIEKGHAGFLKQPQFVHQQATETVMPFSLTG